MKHFIILLRKVKVSLLWLKNLLISAGKQFDLQNFCEILFGQTLFLIFSGNFQKHKKGFTKVLRKHHENFVDPKVLAIFFLFYFFFFQKALFLYTWWRPCRPCSWTSPPPPCGGQTQSQSETPPPPPPFARTCIHPEFLVFSILQTEFGMKLDVYNKNYAIFEEFISKCKLQQISCFRKFPRKFWAHRVHERIPGHGTDLSRLDLPKSYAVGR
jgi:hypothetical protein